MMLLASLAAFQHEVDLEDLSAIVGLSDLPLIKRILLEDWAAFVQNLESQNNFVSTTPLLKILRAVSSMHLKAL